MATRTELTKEQRINKEIRRLKKVFKTLDKNMLQTADSLIRSAARFTVALDDIWGDYNESGYVEEYDNGGGQKGYKASEARRAINEMTKHHTAIMRQLTELTPPTPIVADALQALRDE